MSQPLLSSSDAARIRLSFEFFPPKSEEMAGQLWSTVDELAAWQPEFVSVTYGAGGSTREPTRSTVERLLRHTSLSTASHLTCVGATREEVAQVVDDFRRIGVRHFVALRGERIETKPRPCRGFLLWAPWQGGEFPLAYRELIT